MYIIFPYFIYRTLNELVHHYAINSLEEHNDQLRTVLKYPVNAHLVKKPEKKQLQEIPHQETTPLQEVQQMETQILSYRRQRKQRLQMP